MPPAQKRDLVRARHFSFFDRAFMNIPSEAMISVRVMKAAPHMSNVHGGIEALINDKTSDIRTLPGLANL